jgi:hypothetical protein
MNQEDAANFLRVLGLKVEETKIRKLVLALPHIRAGKPGFSRYRFYNRDGKDYLMAKATLAKIEALYEAGNLKPYQHFLDALEMGETETTKVKTPEQKELPTSTNGPGLPSDQSWKEWCLHNQVSLRDLATAIAAYCERRKAGAYFRAIVRENPGVFGNRWMPPPTYSEEYGAYQEAIIKAVKQRDGELAWLEEACERAISNGDTSEARDLADQIAQVLGKWISL